jgi:hypothetical protein
MLTDEEAAHVRTMLTSARALQEASDPLLQGYFAHLAGRLEELLLVIEPEAPEVGEPR